MAEPIYFQSIAELKKAKSEIERKLNIKIKIEGKKAVIEGEPVNEYEAEIILNALSFGFSAKKALLLTQEGVVFKKINIKDFTRRKNLEDVRARIIGKEGKTKHTIEGLANCELMIKNNEVGVISSEENINEVIIAIGNIARGAKQANVYAYLEKTNVRKKEKSDLGLKPEKEEI